MTPLAWGRRVAPAFRDRVRATAQLVYNQTMSTTVPALVADASAIVEAVVSPPAAADSTLQLQPSQIAA